MSRRNVYDNWERLVEATLDREKLRQLALCESFSSSVSLSDADFSSRFSFISAADYVITVEPRRFSLSPRDLKMITSEASGISSNTINPTAFPSRSIPSFAARPIELEEIKKATKNFHSDVLLGEGRFDFVLKGGFGPVLKGWIHEDTLTAAKPGFGIAVAVKNWNSRGKQAHKDWRAELNYLSQLHHPNLVKLIGYCSEEDNLFLVYEFMPKGSLDNHIFRNWQQLLSWNQRIKVAVGAARALSFLHNREIQVIFGNFRPDAVLLDGEFNAKLWDFSLARDGPTGDMTHVSTEVIGTYGYAAPEYVATGCLTAKCDVYAFGVVLLELLTGRRVMDKNRIAEEQNLVEWAKPYLAQKRKWIRIMDTKLGDQYPIEGAYSVAILALQCLNNDRYKDQRWLRFYLN